MVGVLPAHERLGAAHRAGGEIEARLVAQAQVVLGEGAAQLPEERQAPDAGLVEVAGVDGGLCPVAQPQREPSSDVHAREGPWCQSGAREADPRSRRPRHALCCNACKTRPAPPLRCTPIRGPGELGPPWEIHMRIHHLNCISSCPLGGKLMAAMKAKADMPILFSGVGGGK